MKCVLSFLLEHEQKLQGHTHNPVYIVCYVIISIVLLHNVVSFILIPNMCYLSWLMFFYALKVPILVHKMSWCGGFCSDSIYLYIYDDMSYVFLFVFVFLMLGCMCVFLSFLTFV